MRFECIQYIRSQSLEIKEANELTKMGFRLYRKTWNSLVTALYDIYVVKGG